MVAKIRSDILAEDGIRDLVKVVDEEMGGVAREQRKRLRTIEDELQDVKRQMDRIWRYIATSSRRVPVDVLNSSASDSPNAARAVICWSVTRKLR